MKKKDFGDNSLTDKIVYSPLHLRTYTWNCFSWHACQFCLDAHLRATNRNATMGCPLATGLPTPSKPLAVTKKLGGSSVGTPWRSWQHPSPNHEYRM